MAYDVDVTPYVGVWIETRKISNTAIQYSVTPYVGVWIETRWKQYQAKERCSHTLRGCVD